ncbi:hypothetical protein C8K30_1011009 [Promicromonospora sp. AC04]|uniref:hypothetical protein n=1 Tax=Promicromonospora sp. AC04 TaxID=2135723 RepID=UPI000D3D6D91|nr:hypothetical protein [Promicromonospora sp. AC04]PUB32483.1 hypothetical protein C8K30_1011009 [Promicromonospora sp. AC04]
MRTAGLTMNDVWAHRVLRERGVETYRIEGVAAEIGVLVESLDLEHRSKEENYRPYLHLTGELRSITPDRALPYEVTQVTYSPGHGERVDAFYEFSDTQLVALATKGYFTAAFAVPEQVTGIEWELPTTVDVLVLAPSGEPTDGDAPVVFTRVHDIAGLEIDRESCGYDLAEYFANHFADRPSPAHGLADERALLARSEAVNSLFTQDELDTDAETGPAASPDAHMDQAADGVTLQLQQVEAEIAEESAHLRAERERIEGTFEYLYQERVAQVLRASDDHTERTRDPRRAQTQPPALDELGRQQADRGADLEHDDVGEPSLES